MQSRESSNSIRPGIVIHRQADRWQVDLVEDVSSCLHALPPSNEIPAPIVIMAKGIGIAHKLYKPIRFVVQELARREAML